MTDGQSRDQKRLVIGNWKCTKSIDEARSWFDTFAGRYQPVPGVEVVVAPPLIMLAQLSAHLKQLGLAQLSLAAQDVSPFPLGSYTGATAADMLKGISAYAIAGHSERRRYFHETAQDVTNKVSEAVDAGIKPIVCVDKDHAMSQLTALGDIDCDDLVIAYCPVDAMSYREPETVENVAEFAAYISQVYPAKSIVYGGSIGPENAARYLAVERLSGVFVGAASFDPDSFLEIVRTAQQR